MGDRNSQLNGYRKPLFIGLFVVVLAINAILMPLSTAASPSCNPISSLCEIDGLLSFEDKIQALSPPVINTPDWMKPKVTFSYTVQTKGVITTDITEFKQLVNQTLNDARGWSKLDLNFREVSSGGNFILYISEASQLPTFSATGCSVDYSCRVGNNVIINQNRWLGATDSWNSAGGSLRDYRHMVINHEVGHWLGHDHQSCSGAGQPAPLMQQQSIDLGGCKFNPWPLDSELWTSRL